MDWDSTKRTIPSLRKVMTFLTLTRESA
ncbi:hypothetical protein BLAT2472_30003 [Burkholderia latens]